MNLVLKGYRTFRCSKDVSPVIFSISRQYSALTNKYVSINGLNASRLKINTIFVIMEVNQLNSRCLDGMKNLAENSII